MYCCDYYYIYIYKIYNHNFIIIINNILWLKKRHYMKDCWKREIFKKNIDKFLKYKIN